MKTRLLRKLRRKAHKEWRVVQRKRRYIVQRNNGIFWVDYFGHPGTGTFLILDEAKKICDSWREHCVLHQLQERDKIIY